MSEDLTNLCQFRSNISDASLDMFQLIFSALESRFSISIELISFFRPSPHCLNYRICQAEGYMHEKPSFQTRFRTRIRQNLFRSEISHWDYIERRSFHEWLFFSLLLHYGYNLQSDIISIYRRRYVMLAATNVVQTKFQ